MEGQAACAINAYVRDSLYIDRRRPQGASVAVAVARALGGQSTISIGAIGAADDIALLTRILGDLATVVRLDERSAWTAVRADEITVLIVPPLAEGSSASADLAALRAAAALHHVPVFALVPRGNSAAMAAAFGDGAADCVGYPIDPGATRARIGALLKRKAVDDRLRAETAEVRRLAHTDPVTGVWNRRHLDSALERRIDHATTQRCPLSLLMIDIDRFKTINDRHGHAIGDKVLRAVANRLRVGIRDIDTLARFGGDELALVMPDAGLGIARGVAHRLCALVADCTAVPFRVTISVGVAEFAPGDSVASLLAKSDSALYAAKVGGRNRVAEAS